MSHWALFELLNPQIPPLVTNFLQQGHTYSNKSTPNSATTWEPMWPICIETATVHKMKRGGGGTKESKEKQVIFSLQFWMFQGMVGCS